MTKDLNRLSAERIMGYKSVCSPDIEKYPLPYVEDAEGNRFTWTPLTDMNQCFMVMEKMEEERAEVIIRKQETSIFYKGFWYCCQGKSRAKNTITAALKAAGAWEE